MGLIVHQMPGGGGSVLADGIDSHILLYITRLISFLQAN